MPIRMRVGERQEQLGPSPTRQISSRDWTARLTTSGRPTPHTGVSPATPIVGRSLRVHSVTNYALATSFQAITAGCCATKMEGVLAPCQHLSVHWRPSFILVICLRGRCPLDSGAPFAV